MPISLFCNALINHTPCQNLYLGIGWIKSREKKRNACITPVQAERTIIGTEFANFQYILGPLFVDVIYSSQAKYMEVAHNIWHPNSLNKILPLSTPRNNRHVIG